MSLDATGLFDKVVSHALASGLFERVNSHEPKSSPGHGLTAAVWVQTIEPLRRSGLAATSARVTLFVRIYSSMLAEPQDAIDPAILSAASVLFEAYSGDFDLGATTRNVDLLGSSGVGLSAQAGYVPIDNKVYRAMTITLPVLVNDVWEQVA